jgi:hypothetical protein
MNALLALLTFSVWGLICGVGAAGDEIVFVAKVTPRMHQQTITPVTVECKNCDSWFPDAVQASSVNCMHVPMKSKHGDWVYVCKGHETSAFLDIWTAKLVCPDGKPDECTLQYSTVWIDGMVWLIFFVYIWLIVRCGVFLHRNHQLLLALALFHYPTRQTQRL